MSAQRYKISGYFEGNRLRALRIWDNLRERPMTPFLRRTKAGKANIAKRLLWLRKNHP